MFSLIGWGFAAAACAYSGAFLMAKWAGKRGVLKLPTGGRHVHDRPTPEFGGIGIGMALLVLLGIAGALGVFEGEIRMVQLGGFLVGLGCLLGGGFLDDRYGLRPRTQILFPMLAACAVIVTGTGIVQVTRLGGVGAFSLVWAQWPLPWGGWLSLPSDVLTFVWLLAVIYATKLMDGLDGLVTGLGIIGAGMIGALALSVAFFQPAVALFAMIVGGAFFGFLPRNLAPAKQFLGEAGSTIVGFSLGFLSIVSGTKVATALMVLGVPLMDAACVLVGRVVRGVPITQGDRTHLHHRLLDAGLTKRQVVIVIWSVSLVFGLLALGFQTRGKLFLLLLLGLVTAGLSLGAGWITHRRTRTV